MMKIITTPMCEDVLKLAGLKDYTVVGVNEIKNADLAILLSETECEIPKLAIKLNTYTQIYESIMKIHERFDTKLNEEGMEVIDNLIQENSNKRNLHKDIKVKVHSNFLKDTVEDMGFCLASVDYDYVVCPDYLLDNVTEDVDIITVPSHKNVSTNIIERINERYALLERELCMKQ